jgi:hypothetical protein
LKTDDAVGIGIPSESLRRRVEGFLFPRLLPQFLIDTLAIRNASNHLKINDREHF